MITALIALYCVHAGNIGGAVVALALGRILGIIFSNKREDYQWILL